jgi:preprotein translocase subunit SecD
MKKRNLLQRAIVIAVITIASIYIVIGPHGRRPHGHDFTWPGIKQNLANNIHLGLDLKGGSHLVMRVKVDEYLKRLSEDSATAAANAAKDGGFEIKDAHAEVAGGNYQVILQPADPSKAKDIRAAVEKKVDLGSNAGWSYSQSGGNLVWSLGGAARRLKEDEATEQAMKIIETRINTLGVTEPTLQRHGAQTSHEILLQMPGITDPEHVKQLLKAQSRLELVHIVGTAAPASAQTYTSKEEAVASLNSGGNVPTNRRVLPYSERAELASSTDQNNAAKPTKWVVVESPAIIDGSELRNASAVQAAGGGTDDYQIQFSLKKAGADKFGTWTGANINEYMGVVLNDEVKSIAYIKSQIFDTGEISGRFSKQSADDLALTLRSGALPAPIEYQEERSVGPSLGADSIRSGVRASLLGLALVVGFMLIYYRGSGINAVVALLLNMVLMMAGLIMFGATLTLPGIAGMILTIGMAVDSNVLIFERIREEWRSGKTVPSAVEQGFAHAFVTIIDTHVTTIVSSVFLYFFSSGAPMIRGFAVTLVLGLVVNLFSAVYVSRTIFMWLLSRKGRRVESLSI